MGRLLGSSTHPCRPIEAAASSQNHPSQRPLHVEGLRRPLSSPAAIQQLLCGPALQNRVHSEPTGDTTRGNGG